MNLKPITRAAMPALPCLPKQAFRCLVPAIMVAITLFFTGPAAYAQSATVDQVVYDHMGAPYRADTGAPWGANEGLLHGMPTSWAQYNGAFAGVWSSGTDGGQAVNAIQPWGECYEWAGGSPVKNVRIQIRNFNWYAYIPGNGWIPTSSQTSDGLGGTYATENTYSGVNGPAQRDESANGGGASWSTKSGDLIHWWVDQFPHPARPAGVVAYFGSCEIRLIADTVPSVNLNNAKYLACVSADVYLTPSTTGATDSMSIPRHRFLSPQWQTFTSYISPTTPTSETDYKNQILGLPLPPGVTNSSGSGSLTGSVTTNTTTANLTTEGAVDWIHWGDSSLTRKASGGSKISTYSIVGAGSATVYINDLRGLTWTDGSPTVQSTANKNGLYIPGIGKGFSFQAPADTTTRTLTVHVGGWNSGGTFVAHLSDGSVADLTNTSSSVNGQYDRNYTVTYKAGAANQTLTITWTMGTQGTSTGTGNVTLNGAALQ